MKSHGMKENGKLKCFDLISLFHGAHMILGMQSLRRCGLPTSEESTGLNWGQEG